LDVRRWLFYLLLVAAALSAPLFFGRMDVGGGRWPVKTFRDRDRDLVRMQPVDATVAELSWMPRPADDSFRGLRRIPPVELTVYRVEARLRDVIDGLDGDIHLLLADPKDPSRTMIAEIPMPMFAIGSGLGEIFEQERREVRRRRRSRGAIVQVTGIGFFDPSTHDTLGVPRGNGLELHPVIALKFLAPETRTGAPR
jgi:hypothetical protein